MNQQIKKVLYYIESNIEEPFLIEDLAKVAGYSPFHFCRIFKLSVGESVMEYIIRLRLEKGALKLFQTNLTIDVALDIGYQTPNGFNKAFKKVFGLTPTEYKKQKTDFLENYKGKLMETPKIVTLEDKHIVFVRQVGEYMTSSTIAWKSLSNSLNALVEQFKNDKVSILLDPKEGELIGICHDDPSVTKPENIRYDAAIAWEKKSIDILGNYGLDTKKISGGKYIMVNHYGDIKEENLDTWLALYNWCNKNGYKLRDAPSFEKYSNDVLELDSGKHLIQLYIPIE